ncbi:DUF445 domain-containing protein [Chengkuizengella sediminis]|uniref:DUF445 domain-containing protein n=1 Tax=Chengkuizengella sediminis TaxID=1885917 RepID=UPI0013897CA0|nr:DUF445 family protein [Chengkuizengella sediminis]NDI36303.1 DUF445 family protein [Chengkuizengella sediminis]
MNTFVMLFASIIIGACIGGLTNYLAIKMLFYPRKALYLFKKKIPFTPGLIPKRKDEIAVSLGRVVGDYLVTSEGLSQMVSSPEFKRKVESKCNQWFDDLLKQEVNLEDLVLRYWTKEQVEEWKGKSSEWAYSLTNKGIEWLWVEKNWSSKTFVDLIPNWNDQQKEKWAQTATDYILFEIGKELQTERGDRMLQNLTGQFMEQAGGLMGTLAGLFMDGQKITTKVKAVVIEQLDSPTVNNTLYQFFYHKISDWEKKGLSEWMDQFSDREDHLSWLREKTSEVLKWEEWLNRLLEKPLQPILQNNKQSINKQIPVVLNFLLGQLSKNVEQIVSAIELPQLVQSEVNKFPTERVEEIVLSVSGKEFRAITWLGAVLGGLIGLVQFVLIISYT